MVLLEVQLRHLVLQQKLLLLLCQFFVNFVLLSFEILNEISLLEGMVIFPVFLFILKISLKFINLVLNVLLLVLLRLFLSLELLSPFLDKLRSFRLQ